MIVWLMLSPQAHKRRMCAMCGWESPVYFVPRRTQEFMNTETGRYLCMRCISKHINFPVVIKVMEAR